MVSDRTEYRWISSGGVQITGRLYTAHRHAVLTARGQVDDRENADAEVFATRKLETKVKLLKGRTA